MSRNTFRKRLTSGLILLIAGSLIIARVYATEILPVIYLPTAGYDDGLYMRLAHFISLGEWLGPFSNMTLAKGPGYPLFLSVVSHTGISISAWHGLIQAGAAAFAGFAVSRLTASAWLGLCTLALILLDPTGLTWPLRRIAREQIYWPQALLTLTLLSVTLFDDHSRWRSAAWGMLAGVAFAWIWMTREEGVWLVPGLVILVAGSAYVGRKDRQRLLLTTSGLLACILTALGALGIVATINKAHYGTLRIVDLTEQSFQSAMSELGRIQTADRVDFVPVSSGALRAAISVSPAFTEVGQLLLPEGQLGRAWGAVGCSIYPSTCGSIAGGWFFWALRDAARELGHYSSSAASADYFRVVSSELHEACELGKLHCDANYLPIIPHFSSEALARLPAASWETLRQITLFLPESSFVAPETSFDEQFPELLRLLNEPIVAGARSEDEHLKAVRKALEYLDLTFRAVKMWVAGLALLCWISALITASLKRSNLGGALITATAGWTMVACRVALLAMIDATSFPAANSFYAVPASYLLLPTIALSVFSFISAIRERPAILPQRNNG